MDKDFSDKPIIVLGMHKSATSLIARSLHKEGVNMGDRLMLSGKSNIDGYYENLDFVELNNEILSSLNHSWNNPPEEKDILNTENKFCSKIKNVLNKAKKSKWGWKDPRTVLTIKLFDKHLDDPIYICCFRKPEKVAKSLMIRNNMSFNKAYSLAKEYNKRLLRFLVKFCR